MGGATSVMPVIRDVFSQQAADATQWADTIDWTVRCDWLQVASSRIISYTHNQLVCYRVLQDLCNAKFPGLVASFIVVAIAFSCDF